MRILLSKLPPSGWWQKGVPKYDDNPAMIRGSIPDLNILESERSQLISIIKDAGHEVFELDFPQVLDRDNPKHDFIFIRDPFISDQNGTAIILRAGEPSRRLENEIIKSSLETLEMNILQMPDRRGLRADGGEFYYCAKEKILFSGLQRNTINGADYVAGALNVEEMVLLQGEGFHLDTFFTPCINNKGEIAALIICNKLLSDNSKKHLYQFADNRGIHVFDIPKKDAIGTINNIGTFAANALPLPGLLIRPNYFSDPSIDEKLIDLGINIAITPTSQFQLSGGSIHCITNEI